MKLIHAEKMFSHSTPSIPLDETYTDFSVEKLFEEYKKAIPELTIDDSERLRINNERLQKEKHEHAKATDTRVSKLEKDIEEMKMLLRRKETIKENKN